MAFSPDFSIRKSRKQEGTAVSWNRVVDCRRSATTQIPPTYAAQACSDFPVTFLTYTPAYLTIPACVILASITSSVAKSGIVKRNVFKIERRSLITSSVAGSDTEM